MAFELFELVCMLRVRPRVSQQLSKGKRPCLLHGMKQLFFIESYQGLEVPSLKKKKLTITDVGNHHNVKLIWFEWVESFRSSKLCVTKVINNKCTIEFPREINR